MTKKEQVEKVIKNGMVGEFEDGTLAIYIRDSFITYKTGGFPLSGFGEDMKNGVRRLTRLYKLEPCEFQADMEILLNQKNILKHAKKIVWENLFKNEKTDIELLEKKLIRGKSYVNWVEICVDHKLPEPFIEKYANELDWYLVSRDQNLSEPFIEKYAHKIYWHCVGNQNHKLSEAFIKKHADKLNWKLISANQNLSISLVEKFKDKIHWEYVGNQNQKLSEAFIKKHADKLNWRLVSLNQNLSESLIEKFKDKVDWGNISFSQFLFESFIEKFADKVDWEKIFRFQCLSNKFVKKHEDKLKKFGLTKNDVPLAVIRNCGNSGRIIRIFPNNPKEIRIGCFVGTKQEAITAIKEKYGDTKEGKKYIKKVKKCFKLAKKNQ